MSTATEFDDMPDVPSSFSLFSHILSKIDSFGQTETLTVLTSCVICPTKSLGDKYYENCPKCALRKEKSEKPSSKSNSRFPPIFEEILTHQWDPDPMENCLKIKVRWNRKDKLHPTWHKYEDLLATYGGLNKMNSMYPVKQYLKTCGLYSMKQLLIQAQSQSKKRTTM